MVIRSDKDRAGGLLSIGLLYQVAGERKYYSTKHKVYLENWDAEAQAAVYISKKTAATMLPNLPVSKLIPEAKIKAINEGLDFLRGEVSRIELGFNLAGIEFTANDVINKLKQIRPKKQGSGPVSVCQFINQHISESGTVKTKGSLQVYKSLISHLEAYGAKQSGGVHFSSVDTVFFERFFAFLITERDLLNTTANKQISTLQTLLRKAIRAGIDVNPGFKDYRTKNQALEVIALTEAEFNRLRDYPLPEGSKLNRIRDIFIFSCATGLRYSDLKSLKRENIKGNAITLTIRKTRQNNTIPLNAVSAVILQKYSGDLKPLPVPSGPKLNLFIKELMKTVGINDPVEIVRYQGEKRLERTFPKYELLSIHSARKTFATLSLSRGMPVNIAMALGGWVNYQSFKRYVSTAEDQKKESMNQVWGSPE